jgi:hypothetical protein
VTPEDELACARLMLRASHHADLHQIDAFVALFAKDGWVDRMGDRFTGPAEIRRFMENRKRERVTRHVIAPPIIEFAGPDEAQGGALFTLYDAIAGDDQAVMPVALPATVGEFRQTYRKRDGDWKITSHASIATFRRA